MGGIGSLTINGDFTQASTGVLTVDRPSATSADAIAVSGNVTLGGTLNLNQSGVFADRITLIDGGTGLSGSFDNTTGLLGGLLISQAIELDQALFDVNLVTTMIDAATIGGLTANQATLANHLTTQLGAGVLTNGLTELTTQIGALSNVGELTPVLDELSPEMADAGLQVFQNSNLLFMMGLLNQPSSTANGSAIVKTASRGAPHIAKTNNDGPNIWGSVQFTHFDQNGGVNNIDFDTNGFEISTGFADIEAGPLTLGFVASYADLNTETQGGAPDEVRTQIYRLAAHGRADLNAEGPGLNGHVDGAIGFTTGTQDIDQNIIAPTVNLAAQQSGDTGIESFNGILRLQLDGSGGEDWVIKPHVLAAYETVIQDEFTIGNDTATAIGINEERADRYTLGYGATLDHDWGEGSYAQLRASGLHHFGDTQASLVSQFTSSSVNGFNFATQGKEIKNQYVVEGAIGRSLGAGWTGAAEAFAEFGDIEGYGGRVRFKKTFE